MQENESQMKRAIEDSPAMSERVETVDADAIISEYVRRANAKPYVLGD